MAEMIWNGAVMVYDFIMDNILIINIIFALIIGVVVGTAATIFLATPIAYDLMTKRAKADGEK